MRDAMFEQMMNGLTMLSGLRERKLCIFKHCDGYLESMELLD